MEQAIFKIFGSFGFNQVEIEIYVFLAKTGPLRAKDVASKLEIPKQRVYSFLKALQRLKAVYTIQDRPTKYCALPFAQLLDLYTNSKIDEAQTIQKNKEKLLKKWLIITKSKEFID